MAEDNDSDRVIVTCKSCRGTGILGIEPCSECDGKGHRTLNKQVYYRQLRREQKNRLEVEK